jgi:PAS domain S-box-containing protein
VEVVSSTTAPALHPGPTPVKMPLRSLIVAVVCVAVAFLLNALIPIFAQRGALVLYLAAVVLAIWYGGWKPGLVASVLAILGAAWVLPPENSMRIEQRADVLRFAMFVAVSALITLMHRSLENARARLALTERRLIASVEAARVAAWEQDLATGVFWYTPNFKLIFGHTSDESHGTYESFIGYIHPDDQARAREAFALALTRHPDFELEYRIIRTDGEIRWIHTRGRVYSDESGKPTRMAGIVADVSETKNRGGKTQQATSFA